MQLTVQSNRSLGFSKGIFADTPIVSKVAWLKVPYGEAHVRPIAIFLYICRVLVCRQDHRVVEHPVADGSWMGLRVTIDRHVGARRRAHQLVRHPNHRRNWPIKNVHNY